MFNLCAIVKLKLEITTRESVKPLQMLYFILVARRNIGDDRIRDGPIRHGKATDIRQVAENNTPISVSSVFLAFWKLTQTDRDGERGCKPVCVYDWLISAVAAEKLGRLLRAADWHICVKQATGIISENNRNHCTRVTVYILSKTRQFELSSAAADFSRVAFLPEFKKNWTLFFFCLCRFRRFYQSPNGEEHSAILSNDYFCSSNHYPLPCSVPNWASTDYCLKVTGDHTSFWRQPKKWGGNHVIGYLAHCIAYLCCSHNCTPIIWIVYFGNAVWETYLKQSLI